MGRDTPRRIYRPSAKSFQSTRPVWGATLALPDVLAARLFQSTRPVWGATNKRPAVRRQFLISIHAPRMGRDRSPRRDCRPRRDFNPRAPYGARHEQTKNPQAASAISIHAPRMGRDWRRPRALFSVLHFNPRAPYGARQTLSYGWIYFWHFNPRAPYGARRRQAHCVLNGAVISIHAPRMGRDSKTAQFSCTVLRKSNSKYNAADNSWAKYACGIVQATRTYPNFRCEAPGKRSVSLRFAFRPSARPPAHSRALTRSALSASDTYRRDSKTADCPARHQ